MTDAEFVLSIEAAVAGGSLSILDRRGELDFWLGERAISKSEDLLENISRLLEKNEIDKNRIALITVSEGVGSLTGQKIALALAKGLRKSVGCRLETVSVLEALRGAATEGAEVLAAIPLGEERVFWQRFGKPDFESRSRSQATICSQPEFDRIVEGESNIDLFLHEDLYQRISETEFWKRIESEKKHIIRRERNLARLIALKILGC